jgi:hypothetical protein
MADSIKRKLGMGGIVILALIVAFALFVAFVAGPMISQSSGIADEKVSFILGAIFFVIALVCASAAKYLNKKKPEDSKNV